MRILSLLPSATETVYALGLGDNLVGISHACDYPPEVKTKPVVSTNDRSSTPRGAEIHGRVSAHRHPTHSLYRVDEQFLRQINPEVILTHKGKMTLAKLLSRPDFSIRSTSQKSSVLSSRAVISRVAQPDHSFGTNRHRREMA